MEKCRRMKRQRCMSKNWIFLDWKSSITHQLYCRSESFAMKTGIPTMDQWSKTTSHWDGIRIICNTENFYSIVVPGLSSSSSGSWSTSKKPSRQESHSSSSSSTSSPSPTESEIQTRERKGQTESDISPVCVSTTVDERSERPDIDQAKKNRNTNTKEPKREQSDPLFTDSSRASSEIPEKLQQFRENALDDEIPEHGNFHANSSHEESMEPIRKRREDLCKNSVLAPFPDDRNFEMR